MDLGATPAVDAGKRALDDRVAALDDEVATDAEGDIACASEIVRRDVVGLGTGTPVHENGERARRRQEEAHRGRERDSWLVGRGV